MSPPFHSFWITASGKTGQSGSHVARFPYWSLTKTALAIVALRLVERGTLDLETPLPDQSYSLRHLLAHTSGLPDYTRLPDYHAAVAARADPWPQADMLKRAMKQGMLFAPGQGWSFQYRVCLRGGLDRNESAPDIRQSV